MSLKIALDIPEEHSYIGMVRQILRTLLERHHGAPEDTDDLELVVGELCANATRHARSATGCYCVTLEHHGDHVVVVVTDRGRGFDVEEIAPMGSPRQAEGGTVRYGGFGLHLVGTLTDQMEILPSEPTGTTVRVKKRLRHAVAEPGIAC